MKIRRFTKFLQYKFTFACGISLALAVAGSTAQAQDAKLKQALSIKPKQSDVDYDQPDAAAMKECEFSSSKNPPGFVVTDGTNRVLRQFFDTNKDGKLDQWSYFKNGIEVYRDIDSDFDRRTDAYRWLGTGGTRWGLDPDQDGKIDSWKFISAEEVAYEAFQAIANQDHRRFECLLIDSTELQALKLGDRIGKEVRQRLQQAKKDFPDMCKSQKQITRRTEWVHASFGTPSMAAAGSHGIDSDIILYDHASAVFKSKDFGQLALGSIVQTQPGAWRLIELPEIVQEGKPLNNGGAFFPMPSVASSVSSDTAASPVDSELAEKYGELAELEKDLAATKKEVEIAKIESKKASLLEEIFNLTDQSERKRDWLENIADSVASAYQNERFPGGLKFLDGFVSRLEKADYTDGLDYVRWRSIFAKYGLATELGSSKEREEAHDELIDDLKLFQDQFKKSPISADALTQLGIHFEINGKPEESIEWYEKAVDRFPETQHGKRAAGALTRLQNKGKRVLFVGEDIRGRKFSLRDPRLRDKIVVLHYWETWCAEGLEDIQRLVEKYKDEAVFVGCNIESETEDFKKFMAENPDFAAWPQLHAPGSMERSPLALQFGVPSEPMILLFNGDGELVETDVPFSDLEREIERLRRR